MGLALMVKILESQQMLDAEENYVSNRMLGVHSVPTNVFLIHSLLKPKS